MKLLAAIALCIFLLNSCSDAPVFPVRPHIEFVSITPSQGIQYQDNLTITIHFEDGDGDLGFVTDPVANLFVRDMRPGMPDSEAVSFYNIPNLTPDTHRPSIQGPLSVSMIFPRLLDPSNLSEDVNFSIWLVDRAGNMSDTITTSTVTITQ